MPKITPFLWFNNNVQEALDRYTSIFTNARVVNVSRNGDGSAMHATFELEGQEFMALNGGPHYTFTPAVSMFVKCQDQAEVDYFWEKLIEGGGSEEMCGWLKDPFGLSWQIIPNALTELMSDPDPAKSGRVIAAMLQMHKIDIAGLRKAHAGE